ncbi:MAG: TonB-dependent receptor [Xanthomonadales bacterium]|nr:TonB-dependent receptor [Xanthomonadales bacterium]
MVIAASLSVGTAALAEDSDTPTTPATTETGAPEDKPIELDVMTVLGSRRYGRSSEVDTPVPVDVIPMVKAAEQGSTFDLAQTLQYTAPSFTSGRQTGADNADSVDSAALRGLGSDQTLVLVNGKRLHSTALVNLFGARNRGNTGTDLNTIPLLAIDQVEILRDGAAAQYGSDAIAGVMNINLKRSKGCEAVAGYGQYSRGDGENYLASGYCGFAVGNDGVVALTAEYLDRGRSNRAEAGNPRTIGDTSVKNGTLYVNGDIPVGDGAHLYFDGGVQNRDASSAAFARGGIGSDDIPSRNSEAMYPNGFVPYIDPYIQDRHFTGGMWWMWNDWRVDASQTLGYNKLVDTIRNTLNASIANLDLENGGAGISPSVFNAGGFSFAQQTTNLDFTRFYADWLSGVNVAFGSEFRHEDYEIFAGNAGSYIDADGAGGGNAGSQGFPGFQPADATIKSRNSWAGYGDIEINWTDRFLTDQAVRYEHYSDFGSTVIGKVAGSYRVSDGFLMRGSVSSGFRAPSLQQRYFSSTFTDFISGEPVDVVLAPNGGTIARAAGIPDLKEEKSRSATLGFTWEPWENLSLTLDGYHIDIDDRIVLTGYFGTDDPSIGTILQQLGVGQAQFFVNSVDTRTQGIDLTARHTTSIGDGELTSFLAFNNSTTRVKRVNTPASLVGREDSLLGERDRLFIEGGAPRSKATLGFDYATGNWDSSLKVIYFGQMTLGTFSGPPVPNQHYSDKTSLDASLTYSFSEKTKLTIGGANLLDKFPTRQNADETDNGFRYEAVQFGLNGAAYFVRLAHKF